MEKKRMWVSAHQPILFSWTVSCRCGPIQRYLSISHLVLLLLNVPYVFQSYIFVLQFMFLQKMAENSGEGGNLSWGLFLGVLKIDDALQLTPEIHPLLSSNTPNHPTLCLSLYLFIKPPQISLLWPCLATVQPGVSIGTCTVLLATCTCSSLTHNSDMPFAVMDHHKPQIGLGWQKLYLDSIKIYRPYFRENRFKVCGLM